MNNCYTCKKLKASQTDLIRTKFNPNLEIHVDCEFLRSSDFVEIYKGTTVNRKWLDMACNEYYEAKK